VVVSPSGSLGAGVLNVSLELAAVVVTYNSARVIDECLGSLKGIAETVVVDNGSVDGTCAVVSAQWPSVKLIANPDNRGFAGAANQGARATRSPLVLFLNPDAAILGGLESLTGCFDDPKVGAAGGRLVDAAGSTQVGFTVRRFPTCGSIVLECLLANRLWPGNPVNRRYRCLDLDYEKLQQVDQPAGAFLVLRRSALESAGGWDEQFFPLWFEDVHLCWKIRTSGYSILFDPRAVARHEGGHSIESIRSEEKHAYWYGSLLLYSYKHFSPAKRGAVRVAVFAGALLRMAATLLQGGSWQSYSRVMGLALRRQTKETRQVQPHALM